MSLKYVCFDENFGAKKATHADGVKENVHPGKSGKITSFTRGASPIPPRGGMGMLGHQNKTLMVQFL